MAPAATNSTASVAGNVFVPSLCLSVLGGIQPGPLAAYLRDAIADEGDDGLIGRFQLAVYPDQDREFRLVDRPPDRDAKDRAFAVFKAMDDMSAAEVGATRDDDGSIPYLRFSPDAQEFFNGWLTELENTKLRAGESPSIESHLAKYRSLMPSLALLFHLIDVADSGRPGAVSLDAAARAAGWCDFLEAHARRIYHASLGGDIHPARSLAEKLASSTKDPSVPFTAREIYRKQLCGLTRQEDVERSPGRPRGPRLHPRGRGTAVSAGRQADHEVLRQPPSHQRGYVLKYLEAYVRNARGESEGSPHPGH